MIEKNVRSIFLISNLISVSFLKLIVANGIGVFGFTL